MGANHRLNDSLELFHDSIEHYCNFATVPAGHERIRLVRLLKSETMGNQIFGVDVPANQPL